MKFLLVVFPDGKTILTTRQDVPADEIVRLQETLTEWVTLDDARHPLIITSCDVVYAEEIELDLGTEGIQRGDFIPFETDEPAQG